MLNLLTSQVLAHLIAAVIAADLLAQPATPGDQRQAEVEGDVRHALRVFLDKTVKAGWLVDVLWEVEPFVTRIRTAIQQQLQTPATPAA